MTVINYKWKKNWESKKKQNQTTHQHKQNLNCANDVDKSDNNSLTVHGINVMQKKWYGENIEIVHIPNVEKSFDQKKLATRFVCSDSSVCLCVCVFVHGD